MTREEIIAMARESGFQECRLELWSGNFLHFAALATANAVAAERDAWRTALAPIFRERMGAEQVLECVQHVIQWRCQK